MYSLILIALCLLLPSTHPFRVPTQLNFRSTRPPTPSVSTKIPDFLDAIILADHPSTATTLSDDLLLHDPALSNHLKFVAKRYSSVHQSHHHQGLSRRDRLQRLGIALPKAANRSWGSAVWGAVCTGLAAIAWMTARFRVVTIVASLVAAMGAGITQRRRRALKLAVDCV